jgi:hypothetical protein
VFVSGYVSDFTVSFPQAFDFYPSVWLTSIVPTYPG